MDTLDSWDSVEEILINGWFHNPNVMISHLYRSKLHGKNIHFTIHYDPILSWIQIVFDGASYFLSQTSITEEN